MAQLFNKFRTTIRKNLAFIILSILFILLIFAYLFHNIVITIKSGEAGILYRRFFGGTVIDKVYPEGVHFIVPWDKMYIYNVRVQEVPYEFDVLSENGLRMHLIISIRYYPEYKLLGLLHKKVGPNYVNSVVIPEIEAVLRIIIGQINAEEVYTTRSSLIEKSINEAIEQVAQRFVKVDDVIIKRIQLPSDVEESIQYKIKQKHLADAYKYKLERAKKEAERKGIEAKGINSYNEIVEGSLSDKILQWKAIQATLELSTSDNAKVVVIGAGKNGLPILGSIPLDSSKQLKTSVTIKETDEAIDHNLINNENFKTKEEIKTEIKFEN